MYAKTNFQKDNNGNLIEIFSPLDTTKLSTSGTIASEEYPRVFRLAAISNICYYKIGGDEATTDDVPLPENMVEYIMLPAGVAFHMAGAQLYVTECV